MPQFKKGTAINLLSEKADVIDTSTLSSDYFSLSDFNNSFGLGKNSFIINNAPKDLRVEIVDSIGNVLYIERSNNFNEIQKINIVTISAHVYKQNASGLGKLTLIGTFGKYKVKYISPIDIDPTIVNSSKVRFYNAPSLEVNSLLAYSSKINNADVNPKTITGTFYSKAIYPHTNCLLDEQYYNKFSVDYRIISSNSNFVSGLKNFIVDFNITSIKRFNSEIPQIVNITSSAIIKNVINDSIIQLNSPLYYTTDSNNKKYVIDVVSGSYNINYSEYLYSEDYFTTASYISESTDLGGGFRYKQYSIAEISYKNLDTFSGTVAGHRVYRKSLNTAGDYELLIDEKFSPNEILKIDRSSIKSFENLGFFYNQNYINLFWFTSSNAFVLQYDTGSYIDSIKATGSFLNNEYFLVKLNTSDQQKNATYIPFDNIEHIAQSGSAYDSNFIKLLGKNEYLISFNCNVLEKNIQDIASFEIYLTGSYTNNYKEPVFNSLFGIKLAELIIPPAVSNKNFINKLEFKYTPINDIIGTLVVVPKKLNSILLSELSLRLNTTEGFSPQSYTTKVLFPVSQPNELFDIKSELYNKNSEVIYKELRLTEQFDPSGSSSPAVISSNTNISASNVIINNSLYLQGLDNWGTLAENDLVLGFNNTTKEVGYYTTPDLAGTGLITGDTYPITSSWSVSSSNALTASYLSGSTNSPTSSWSINSLTASSLVIQNKYTSSMFLINTSGSTSAATDASLKITGENTKGGSLYHDFLCVTNTYPSAINQNKFFRVNDTGNFEIINNAYTTTIFLVSDSGSVQVPVAQSYNVTQLRNTGAGFRAGNSGLIFDDGNLHIHSIGADQNMWINCSGSGKLVINGQTGANGGVCIGTGFQSGYVTISGSVSTSITQPYGYLISSGAGTTMGTSPNLYSLTCTHRIMAEEFDAPSDERLKNINGEIELQKAIDLITKITPIEFTWKNGENRGIKTGYSAQETSKAGFDHLLGLVNRPGLQQTTDVDGFVSPQDAQFVLNYEQVIPYHSRIIKYLLEKISALEEQLKKEK